jgi:hypothetical protein
VKCGICHQDIVSGPEAAKRVEERQLPDGSGTVTYGHLQPAGPIEAAQGKLVAAFHNKCFLIAAKREARGGDSVRGRTLSTSPTAYQAGVDQSDLQGRFQEFRELAARLGLGTSSWTAREAYRAFQAGVLTIHADRTATSLGFPHFHVHTLPTYQSQDHLQFAHGLSLTQLFGKTLEALKVEHEALHAQARGEAIQEARQEDPGTAQDLARPERVWPASDPVEIEVGDLRLDPGSGRSPAVSSDEISSSAESRPPVVPGN